MRIHKLSCGELHGKRWIGDNIFASEVEKLVTVEDNVFLKKTVIVE